MKLTLDKRKLMALEPLKSSEETRYYLRGVAIVPQADGSLHLVATNGHALGIIAVTKDQYTIEDGSLDKTIILSYDGIDSKKLLKDQYIDMTLDINLETRAVLVSCGDYLAKTMLIDGDFPDYTKLAKLPKEPLQSDHFRISDKVIKSFKEVLAIYTGASLKGTPIPYFYKVSEEMYLVRGALSDFIGLTMGMRSDTSLYNVPDVFGNLWQDNLSS
jgi:hypothetical protein